MTIRSRLGALCVTCILLLGGLAWRDARAAESAAGFVVIMEGKWSLGSPDGSALTVGSTVPQGAWIYPSTDAGDSRIEIALFSSPTLLSQECGEVAGCPPFYIPTSTGKTTPGTGVLRAVQRLFLEGGRRYEVVTAARSFDGPDEGLRSSVLTHRDDQWLANPPLRGAHAAAGEHHYPVRRIGDDGALGPKSAGVTLSVTTDTRHETIAPSEELSPGLYDVWDRREGDTRDVGQPAAMGTWVLVVAPEHASQVQKRFAAAADAIQWKAADTRVAVLRAYLRYLWQQELEASGTP